MTKKKLIYVKKRPLARDKWLEAHCEVIDSVNEFMPDKPWKIVLMNGCYITSGFDVQKILSENSMIDVLINNGITQVESTFHNDEYHEHPVANIGYNPEEQKWYGWSHRAIQSFGIGDTPKEWYPDKAVEGEPIKNLDEAKQAAIKFAESVD